MTKVGNVVVKQVIKVTVDETKFTPQFIDEFKRHMYPFGTIEQHMEHLGQLYARGVVDEFTNFIEGYGEPSEFGIKFEYVDGAEQMFAA